MAYNLFVTCQQVTKKSPKIPKKLAVFLPTLKKWNKVPFFSPHFLNKTKLLSPFLTSSLVKFSLELPTLNKWNKVPFFPQFLRKCVKKAHFWSRKSKSRATPPFISRSESFSAWKVHKTSQSPFFFQTFGLRGGGYIPWKVLISTNYFFLQISPIVFENANIFQKNCLLSMWPTQIV